MAKTFKIDYRSGVESEQIADSEIDALHAEFSSAGSDIPELEETFSGGNWDFAIYDASEPHAAYSTAYFSIAKND